MATKQQQAYQLMSLFDSYYKSKYGENYKGNRHADKWGFIDMIDDLTFDKAVKVIEYYFKTSPRGGHSRQHLNYHYHEYAEALVAQRKEHQRRREILKKMKEEYEG